jgi:hypothetical protein
MDLAKIHETSSINYHMVQKPQYIFSEYICESNRAQAKQFETFEMDFGIPTPMNELQGRFFTDLVLFGAFMSMTLRHGDTILLYLGYYVLLSNYSATRCSSGFRALARVLTSNCWKKPRAHREKWPVNMPPEIVRMILHELERRDAVAFSQASFAAEQCYYASESQLKNIDVRSFKSSIPAASALGWRRTVFVVLNAMSGSTWNVSV